MSAPRGHGVGAARAVLASAPAETQLAILGPRHTQGAPMRTLRRLPALLLALLLAGCPPDAPTPPPPGGGGAQPPATTEAGGGEQPPASTEAATPAGDATTPWKVIPSDEVREEIYPMLQAAETWPAPAALTPLAEVPAERRPDAAKVKALEELVKFLVHPDLRPKDMGAAVGVDAQGRTFMRLGKDKAQGSASLDVRREADDPRFDFPVFVMTIDDPAAGAQTLERLQRRVRNVVAPDLAKELSTAKHGLEAHPQVNGEGGVAGMALLDRSGFGGQFPYLYAFGTDTHLLVLLQEVPHMSLGDDDGQGPR